MKYMITDKLWASLLFFLSSRLVWSGGWRELQTWGETKANRALRGTEMLNTSQQYSLQWKINLRLQLRYKKMSQSNFHMQHWLITWQTITCLGRIPGGAVISPAPLGMISQQSEPSSTGGRQFLRDKDLRGNMQSNLVPGQWFLRW